MTYELERIINNLKKEKAETEVRAEAWKKVKIVTKKNGQPYQNMNRNFDKATYRQVSYAITHGENELYVYEMKDGVYADDKIACYTHVKGLTDDNKKAKTENYLPKQRFLEQIYEYDLDDIRQAIKERIEYLEDYAIRIGKDIEKVEELYIIFDDEFHDIKKKLVEQCETGVYNDIIRAVVKYII